MYIKINTLSLGFFGYYISTRLACLEDEAPQQLVIRYGDVHFYVDLNLACVNNRERSLTCDTFDQGFCLNWLSNRETF